MADPIRIDRELPVTLRDGTVLRAAQARPLTLAGPVRARLALPGDGAADALWTVTLCVEQGDGALHNLCEGVAHSDAGARAVVVELGDVCVDLDAGQPLVALVAGSSFPRWPRPTRAGTQRIAAGSALELTALPG